MTNPFFTDKRKVTSPPPLPFSPKPLQLWHLLVQVMGSRPILAIWYLATARHVPILGPLCFVSHKERSVMKVLHVPINASLKEITRVIIPIALIDYIAPWKQHLPGGWHLEKSRLITTYGICTNSKRKYRWVTPWSRFTFSRLRMLIRGISWVEDVNLSYEENVKRVRCFCLSSCQVSIILPNTALKTYGGVGHQSLGGAWCRFSRTNFLRVKPVGMIIWSLTPLQYSCATNSKSKKNLLSN